MISLAVDDTGIGTEGPYPRGTSRGRTFVYVLPCREQDLLKVGYSRDPLQRLRALHRRFFDVFDLERALLVGTEHVRDARSIERLLITGLADHRAPAVPRSAAGYTEWFLGVSPQAEALVEQVCSHEGWTLHRLLSQWLRQRLANRGELLFDWSSKMLELIEYAQFNEAPDTEAERLRHALRQVLDTWSGLGMPIRPRVPAR